VRAVLAVVAVVVGVASVARWCRGRSPLVSQPNGLLVSRQWRWLAVHLLRRSEALAERRRKLALRAAVIGRTRPPSLSLLFSSRLPLPASCSA